MLRFAFDLTVESGADTLSLVVNSENTHARGLYEKEGLVDKDSCPVIAPPGVDIRGDWILMQKRIDSAR